MRVARGRGHELADWVVFTERLLSRESRCGAGYVYVWPGPGLTMARGRAGVPRCSCGRPNRWAQPVGV
jgi:hypothetical protein